MRRVREWCIGPEADDASDWREALSRSRIPEGYWGGTPAAIKDPELRGWLERTLESAPQWLGQGVGFYLHGPLNSGKSSIAAILAMDAVRRCERVLWLPVRDVPAVRFGEQPQVAAALQRADVLVLDDLGAERFRLESAAGSALEEVARIVYDRGRSLITTSNISWEDFPGQYSDIEPFVSLC